MTSGQQKRYASHTPDVRTTIQKISSRVKRLAGSSPGREFRLDCVRDETVDSAKQLVDERQRVTEGKRAPTGDGRPATS